MAERTDGAGDASATGGSGGVIEQSDSVNELLREAEQRVRTYKLPMMKPPAGLGSEYTFPDDASHLASVELGTLQLKLTGWYSWSIRCLSREVSDLDAFQTVYDLALGWAMHEEAGRHEKRPIKESLIALAVRNDAKLERLSRVLIRKRAVISQMTDQIKIYEKQLIHLSREQSRREAEMRIG